MLIAEFDKAGRWRKLKTSGIAITVTSIMVTVAGIAVGLWSIYATWPQSKADAISDTYLVKIEVDRSKTASGRGWDYPFQQPDPVPCLALVSDLPEFFCFDTNSPDWGCQNKWNCWVEMVGPKADELIVRVIDYDDGSFGSGESDLIGQAVCQIDETCCLKNNKDGHNSGSVLLSVSHS